MSPPPRELWGIVFDSSGMQGSRWISLVVCGSCINFFGWVLIAETAICSLILMTVGVSTRERRLEAGLAELPMFISRRTAVFFARIMSPVRNDNIVNIRLAYSKELRPSSYINIGYPSQYIRSSGCCLANFESLSSTLGDCVSRKERSSSTE